SIVLLSTAMLATRSLFNLEHQNTGFETEGRYTVDLDLKGSGFKPEGLPGAYRAMEDALKALPGARHVSFARYLPLEGNEWGSCVTVQGHPAPNPNDTCFADWDRVSAEFLDSIGVHVTRGRGFTGSDEGGTVPVALVNEAFVKRFFPRENPIGKHFGVNGVQYSDSFEIVGVTQDFKLTDAREDAQPMFLRPMGQRYTGYKKPEEQGAEESSLYLNRMIVQFDRPQTNAEQIIRGAITGVDRNILVIHVRDYPYVVAANFNDDRLIARLTEAFGLLALVLASVGLYGVMSYTAVRRTGEIGIRMALGASRPRIVSLMARSALTQVIAGVAIGLPVSLLAGRLMGRMLYEVHADDPLALTGAVAALAACVSIAALVPAIRAASIDPMDALRAE
ncbi:MAG TPA: FtsX-like permease family protein, partial [Terracidiphilus sp.]|nr:FtsX-like permease family protein [Terracidiphilus sp.]